MYVLNFNDNSNVISPRYRPIRPRTLIPAEVTRRVPLPRPAQAEVAHATAQMLRRPAAPLLLLLRRRRRRRRRHVGPPQRGRGRPGVVGVVVPAVRVRVRVGGRGRGGRAHRVGGGEAVGVEGARGLVHVGDGASEKNEVWS